MLEQRKPRPSVGSADCAPGFLHFGDSVLVAFQAWQDWELRAGAWAHSLGPIRLTLCLPQLPALAMSSKFFSVSQQALSWQAPQRLPPSAEPLEDLR